MAIFERIAALINGEDPNKQKGVSISGNTDTPEEIFRNLPRRPVTPTPPPPPPQGRSYDNNPLTGEPLPKNPLEIGPAWGVPVPRTPPKPKGRAARILEGLSGQQAEDNKRAAERRRSDERQKKREAERNPPPPPYRTWDAYYAAQDRKDAQRKAEREREAANQPPAPTQPARRRRRKPAGTPAGAPPGTVAPPTTTEPGTENVVYPGAPINTVYPGAPVTEATPGAPPASVNPQPGTIQTTPPQGATPGAGAPQTTTAPAGTAPGTTTAPAGTAPGTTTAPAGTAPGAVAPRPSPQAFPLVGGGRGGSRTVGGPAPEGAVGDPTGTAPGVAGQLPNTTNLPPEARIGANILTTGMTGPIGYSGHTTPAPTSRMAADLPGLAVPGMRRPGTVDVNQQPRVENPDGTFSTIDSISIDTDEGVVLIPTITRDGRKLSEGEAREAYRRGELGDLGVFDSPEAATAYAKKLSEQQGTKPNEGISPTAVGQETMETRKPGTAYGATPFAISPDAMKVGSRGEVVSIDKKGKVRTTRQDGEVFVQDGRVYNADGTDLGTFEEYYKSNPVFARNIRKKMAEARGDEIELAKIELEEIKDRLPDTKRNWKDFFKGLGLGALKGFASGGIAGAIGGAATGGIGAAINPDFDDKMADEFINRPRAQQRYATAMAQAQDAAKLAKAQTEVDIATVDLTKKSAEARWAEFEADSVWRQHGPQGDGRGFTTADADRFRRDYGMIITPNVPFRSQVVYDQFGYMGQLGADNRFRAVYSINDKGEAQAVRFPSRQETTVTVGGRVYPTTMDKALETTLRLLEKNSDIAAGLAKEERDFGRQKELLLLKQSMDEAAEFRKLQIELAKMKNLPTDVAAAIKPYQDAIDALQAEIDKVTTGPDNQPIPPAQWQAQGINQALSPLRAEVARLRMELLKLRPQVEGNAAAKAALEAILNTPTAEQLMTNPVQP